MPLTYGDVDLNLLLVLERVLARESVSEAADDLGLSPSATSRALQRLRDALSDPLLVRAGNRLVPTDRARELVRPATRAIEAARDVFQRVRPFDPRTATGDFVIGLGDELEQAWFPAMVEKIRAQAPGIDLRVRSLTMQSVEEGKRNLLHAAIAPDLTTIVVPNLPDLSDLVHRTLYKRRFVVIGAETLWSEPPDLERYLAAEHVIMSDEGGGRGFMDDLLGTQGSTRRVACSVTTFAAVVRVVRATRMLALVPSEILPTFGRGLVAHPPPVPVPRMEMRLLWHPRHTAQPRHRMLRALVAEVVAEQTTFHAAGGDVRNT
ncbi:MAG: LysR family transcriptional regulator [Myxococcota bacterium]